MILLDKLESFIQSGTSKAGLVLFVLITIALSCLMTRCAVESSMVQNQKAAQEAAHQVFSAELQREKDKTGAETVKRQALELERGEFLALLTDKDSKIHQLQKLVKNAGPKLTSATVATVQTEITASAPAQATIVYLPDSTRQVSYSGHIETEWVSAFVKAGPDSISLAPLRFRDEFEIWHDEERAGWFKPLQPVVHFRSLNPHSSVVDIQSYNVKPKKQSKVVKILKGIVIGLAVKEAIDLARNNF